jgi:hypothetical protein
MCLLTIWSFAMAKDEICVIENVGGIDEVFIDVSIIPFWSHNFSNVENVH